MRPPGAPTTGPDGQTLLFVQQNPPPGRIMILRAGGMPPQLLLGTRSFERDPEFFARRPMDCLCLD